MRSLIGVLKFYIETLKKMTMVPVEDPKAQEGHDMLEILVDSLKRDKGAELLAIMRRFKKFELED